MNKIFFVFLSFLVLMFTPMAYAGGGGFVITNAFSTDDPHLKIVRISFDPKIFICKGLNVTFSFANPEPGDLISEVAGQGLPSITSDPKHELMGGKQFLKCSTYVKLYSNQLELDRLIKYSIVGPNLIGSGDITVSF